MNERSTLYTASELIEETRRVVSRLRIIGIVAIEPIHLVHPILHAPM